VENSKAVILDHCGRVDQAGKCLQRALEHMARKDDPSLRAQVLANLGVNLHRRGQNREALTTLRSSLALMESIPSLFGQVGKIHNIMGAIFMREGEYEASLEELTLAVENYRKVGNRNALGMVLGNRATLDYMMGNKSRAVDSWQEALAIRRRVGDPRGVATTLGNLAEAFYREGEPDRAAAMTEEALEIARRAGDRVCAASALVTLGRIALLKGALSDAGGYLEAAYGELEGIQDLYERIVPACLAVHLQLARDPGGSRALEPLLEECRRLRLDTAGEKDPGLKAALAAAAAAAEGRPLVMGRLPRDFTREQALFLDRRGCWPEGIPLPEH